LDPKFRVFAYYTLSEKSRSVGVCAAFDVFRGRNTVMSEVSFQPFGYLMTCDSEPPDGRLFEITHFAPYGCSERVSQTFVCSRRTLFYRGTIALSTRSTVIEMRIFGLRGTTSEYYRGDH